MQLWRAILSVFFPCALVQTDWVNKKKRKGKLLAVTLNFASYCQQQRCRNEYPFPSHSPPPEINPKTRKALTANKLKRQSRRRRLTWQQPSWGAHLATSTVSGCLGSENVPGTWLASPYGWLKVLMDMYVGTIRMPGMAFRTVHSGFRTLPRLWNLWYFRLRGHGLWSIGVGFRCIAGPRWGPQ